MRVSQGRREGLVAFFVAMGAAGVLYMWWHDTTPASVHGVGPWTTAAGRVTGLLGTYLVVVEVLLMGRVTWLDRLIGMDRLAVWHRRNGEYSISLLVAHAVLTIWGYGLTAHVSLVHEAKSVVLTYTDMLAATVGLALLVLVGVLSGRAVRRHVKYHTWYFLHLYTYIALALSFAHQFATGLDFATHPLNRVIWAVMYGLVAALVLLYRVVKPVVAMARHRFVVVGTVSEGPGLTSVYVSGRRMDDMDVDAGQFFLWRFLTRDGWWQAHPYSLSAAPNGKWLRLTAKALGDHSSQLAALKPGTRVMAEGPYGAFTHHRRRTRTAVLIGAGVGITPLRALLESVPAAPGDVTLVYRATSEADLALRAEIDQIAARRRARVYYLVGKRENNPGYLTPGHLRAMVRDIAHRDVFVCGPPGFTEVVTRSLRSAGVPKAHIHTESFEF
ncbi:MAG TPA: ferredoxin reductase family protein [Acidimicrobiales bacterium]|nr:ferredoxin reductase family protein [Acidimicrobiales bacterium]